LTKKINIDLSVKICLRPFLYKGVPESKPFEIGLGYGEAGKYSVFRDELRRAHVCSMHEGKRILDEIR
jgi:hypothetical protein